MEDFDEYSDMSWLTQESSNVNQSVQDRGNEDNCEISDFGVELVSLEDYSDEGNKHVLYDNVVCEDISSDEELEKL